MHEPIASSNKPPKSWYKITIPIFGLLIIVYLSFKLIIGKPVDASSATISELMQTVVAT